MSFSMFQKQAGIILAYKLQPLARNSPTISALSMTVTYPNFMSWSSKAKNQSRSTGPSLKDFVHETENVTLIITNKQDLL